MTPFEERVLAAAETWFKSLLRFDRIRAHEHSLFGAVAEWLESRKKQSKNPWDVPPTLVHFTTGFEDDPPTLINNVPKESEDPAERPTMRAPAATEDLRKRLKL